MYCQALIDGPRGKYAVTLLRLTIPQTPPLVSQLDEIEVTDNQFSGTSQD
jgi:hypothetical protein